MKKILVIAVILALGACHLMRGDAPDSDYFHTGNYGNDNDGNHR